MEENLVGYLLKALDDDEQRQVEASLATSPDLRARLKLMERALTPLAADAEPAEPPAGLALSALAHVAEHQCRKLPSAPPPRDHAAPSRPWLRRPDVLVAAMLLVVLGGISTSALLHLWRDRAARVECQNNLRAIGTGLTMYCNVHNGDFPRVEESGPHAVAGIFVPILSDNGMLSEQVSLNCPARSRAPSQRRSVRELEEFYEKDIEQFRAEARKLAGGYAYTLGYRDSAGTHHGLRCDSGDNLPIAADRLEDLRQANSANHGGGGQNVLLLGGGVIWYTQRTVGIEGDDIFLNWDNQVQAGKALQDTVLGAGDASPMPKE